MEIDKVLYPTDFSEAARKALPHALEIAHHYKARLYMLHARVPYEDDPNNPDLQFMELDKYEEFLNGEAATAANTVDREQGIETVMIRNISPAVGILEYISEEEVDLTVMGTHGRSGLSHFFLGSVAEKVVRHADCPVLTVPARLEDQNRTLYKKILVAFDYSDYSRSAVLEALQLAEKYDADLEILHVIEEAVHPAFYLTWKKNIVRDLPEITERAQEAIVEFLGKQRASDIGVNVVPGNGKTHGEIVRFADQIEADLIVMGTHGLSGWDRVLLGSTTEAVVRTASCPVLTMKLAQK